MQTKELITGILMGMPTLGRPTNTAWSRAYKSLTPPINTAVREYEAWGDPVADARNEIAQAAIDGGFKYIFFLGDDTQPPGHALHQLYYKMEQFPDIAVCGGVYCSKGQPTFPLVFRGNGKSSYWDWTVGEFFWVSGVGMDCTMVRVEALKQMKRPWFKTIRSDKYLDGIPETELWTEDLWFCDQLTKQLGEKKIWVDSLVLCSHWAYLGGNRWEAFQLRSDSLPFRKAEEYAEQHRDPTRKKILDLGCGPHHYNFSQEVDGIVTRCDVREECSPDFRIDISGRLPFGDEQFDLVFSSHTLEHFGRLQLKDVLLEWLRVLKAGGEFRLIVPSLKYAAQKILENDLIFTLDDVGSMSNDVLNILYGSQEYKENFHRVGFTPSTVIRMYQDLMVDPVEVREVGYNIVAKGIKLCHQQL